MPRSRSRSRAGPRRRDRAPIHGPGGYWELTQRPLQSLMFLLPFIVIYEVGLPFVARDEARQTLEEDIYAHRLIHTFFEWFGVAGYWLPALIVCAVLLAWHFTRGDPSRLEPRAYGAMLVESVVFALPLLVMMLVLTRFTPPPAAMAGAPAALRGPIDERLLRNLLFTVGAGVYEEFVFRLVAIALVHLVAVDVMGLPERAGAVAAVLVSSVAFSLYHFSADNPFAWGTFLQLALAGVYLAGVYLLRGFGIAAVTHTFYDVLVVLMRSTVG